MKAARAKVGVYGGTGSGKTTTCSLLAAAVTKEFHENAPVAFYSTEPGVDFVKPIFAAEGIKLYEDRSKSFSDLLGAVAQAQSLNCQVLIVDSITHVWRELVDAYCKKKRIDKPEFHHWKDIKATWQQWTDLYVNAPLHILVAGRAGNEYEYEVDEKGKKELVKGDSKMKAEGEFGYEADLLIEMFSDADVALLKAVRKKNAPKTHGSHTSHTALVKKSRVWALNGQQFQFPDEPSYKPGGYKAVFQAFRPYFDTLNLKAVHEGIDSSRNSEGMFRPDQSNDWQQARIQKEVLLEDMKNSIELFMGGQDSASKRARIVLFEQVFGVRGWSAIEQMDPASLRDKKQVLREVESLFKQNMPTSEEELLAILAQAKDKVAEDMNVPF